MVLASAQAQTTHGSPVCLANAAEMGCTLWNLIEGIDIHFAGLEGYPRDKVVSFGHCLASLHAAKWAIANTTTFEEAVLLAVNLGDDSDTVGAIAGQLAGAKYGFTGIPAPWREGLAWHTRFASVGSALFLLRG